MLKASSPYPSAGSSNAPSPGSAAAADWPRIGNASTARRSPSCVSPPFASCCENYAIPRDVLGQTLRVQNCYFTDFPGANVVLVHDRQFPGGTFSSDVAILGNTFYDNRKADGNRDHSTVNIFADNTRIIGNRFALPSSATDLQKQVTVACELHGSTSCFNNNSLSYYAGGVIFSENLHHDCPCQEAVGNVMSDKATAAS